MAEKQEGERGLRVPHLEAWRLSNALTQHELHEKAGVARSTIARGEAGEPISLPNVRKLAEAFGISVQQLLYTNPADEGKAVGAA